MTGPPIFVDQFGNKTLPIYFARAITKADIPQFGSGPVTIVPEPPEYETPDYSDMAYWLDKISQDPEVTKNLFRAYHKHLPDYVYAAQLIDIEPQKTKALNDHTRLLSILCDARLSLDSSPLWDCFDAVLDFQAIHAQYRHDPKREEKYAEYSKRLEEAKGPGVMHPFTRLRERAYHLIDLKASTWASLPSLNPASIKPTGPKSVPLNLFYSYSHRDEKLRDKLEAHLSGLKREGLIHQWHDRKITGGREWEGQISENLERAAIILMLVSAYFLASDYCNDVEVKRALEKHDQGSARVVPIILRDCDWSGSVFRKLQALPKDGKAVTSWSNRDAAFTDAAKGLRKIVGELTAAS